MEVTGRDGLKNVRCIIDHLAIVSQRSRQGKSECKKMIGFKNRSGLVVAVERRSNSVIRKLLRNRRANEVPAALMRVL